MAQGVAVASSMAESAQKRHRKRRVGNLFTIFRENVLIEKKYKTKNLVYGVEYFFI